MRGMLVSFHSLYSLIGYLQKWFVYSTHTVLGITIFMVGRAATDNTDRKALNLGIAHNKAMAVLGAQQITQKANLDKDE